MAYGYCIQVGVLVHKVHIMVYLDTVLSLKNVHNTHTTMHRHGIIIIDTYNIIENTYPYTNLSQLIAALQLKSLISLCVF